MKTEIKEFSETAIALDDFKKRLSVVPDYKTTEGYAAGEIGRKELKASRIALEKARLEKGEEARDYLKIVNKEAGRINSVIVGLEQPFIDAKKEVDTEVERKKEEELEKESTRIRGIEDSIAWIRNSVNCSRTVKDIEYAIIQVDKINPEDGFDEFNEAADMAKTDSLQKLKGYLTVAVDQEEQVKLVQIERAKQEAERKVLQEKEDKIVRQREEDERKMENERKAMEEERAKIEAEKADIERLKQEEIDRIQAVKDAEIARVAKEEADRIEAERLDKEQKARHAEEQRRRKEEEESELADKNRFNADAVKVMKLDQEITNIIDGFKYSLSGDDDVVFDFSLKIIAILNNVKEEIKNSVIMRSQGW